MRFAVVDDETGVLEQLPSQLEQLLQDRKIQTDCFQNADDFMTAYRSVSYDALFLDIDMPEMNGFELAEYLRDRGDHIPIVYITARDDLMIHAFRYKALGFVRKRYIQDELPFAVSSILQEMQREHKTIKVTETRAAGGKTHIVIISDIDYIEANRNTVSIHLNRKILTVRCSLSRYMENPDFSDFIQINSGTIVNIARISIAEDSVRFPDGRVLSISRRRLPDVRLAYLNYVKKVLI